MFAWSVAGIFSISSREYLISLSGYSSVGISVTPTSIYKLSRLSSLIGHNVYIMREDLTGFAIGGNKVRKLDYLIGDAIARKTDTLITMKASNFSRNAAAAGEVFGFDSRTAPGRKRLSMVTPENIISSRIKRSCVV